MNVSETAAWVLNRHTLGTRTIIAVAGPPGAGKSTLAESLADELNKNSHAQFAAVVPMDGFHLSNETLIERNRLNRKGAPDTFDVEGLTSLITHIAENSFDIRYPTFDRSLDASITDNGNLTLDTEIVIVEGNYLLLDETPWSNLSKLFDYSIYISPGMKELERRLIQRWLDHGFSEYDAKRKAFENDLPNAETVEMASSPADYFIKSF